MRRLVHLVVTVVTAVAAFATLTSVASAQGTGYLLTVAARECPHYTDVTANLARNNIMESLRDLGADTLYTSGQPISVANEDRGQPDCRPLEDWRLTLGEGIGGQQTGTFGTLSYVRNAFPTAIVTRPEVPERTGSGAIVPGEVVRGAVTIELTQRQFELAAKPNRLWIQGGTPSDPINDGDFPGEYGFAALRCAIDNLNGDNVEWISYPSGGRHVYCYAYYVKPPPLAGTIVVRKSIDSPGQQLSETFGFGGNISYTPDGTFSLSPSTGRPASISFVRGETRPQDAPWRVTESVPEGWELASLECDSRTGESTSAIVGGGASIRLADGDTVTCDYVNRPRPLSTLAVRKRTLGGTGAFPVTVTPPRAPAFATTLVTERPGVAVGADTGFTGPGTFAIDEEIPDSDAGRWRLAVVSCDGVRLPATLPVRVEVQGADAPTCTLTNVFRPNGAIVVDAVTRGGLARIGYRILRDRPGDVASYEQSATTTAEDRPARASGDATDRLRLSRYAITQLQPESGPGDQWSLVAVTCDGTRVTPVNGTVLVRLRGSDPKVACTFENELEKAAVPPEPPIAGDGATDGGDTGGGGSTAGSASGNPVAPNAPVGGVDTGLGGLAGFALRGTPPRAAAVGLGGAGMRVSVPSVGLEAPVDAVGVRRNGELAAPRSVSRAGWWRNGARPGQRGPAVIVGHRDSRTGPAAFAGLERVRRGALVTVAGPGGRATTTTFRVTRVIRVAKDRFPSRVVYGPTLQRSLRLVTCTGRFDTARGHYRDNLVVLATRVGA